MRARLLHLVRAAYAIIDLRDVFAFGGLGSIFYGVYQFSAPAAFTIIGIAVFWLGVRR